MFSEREEKIIKMLNKGNRTVKEMVSKIFVERPPFNAEISISNSISRILKKCDFHDLNWTVEKSKVEGERYHHFKKVKRTSSKKN